MQRAEDPSLPLPKSCRYQTHLWTSAQGQGPLPVCLPTSDHMVGDLGHFPRNLKTSPYGFVLQSGRFASLA